MSKLAIFEEIYRELIRKLSTLENEILKLQCEGWQIALADLEKFRKDPNFNVKPSTLASGFKQGLAELPISFAELPDTVRSSALNILEETVESRIPNFFVSIEEKIDKVIARGKIKTETEYYLIKLRMDKIQTIRGSELQIEALDNLLFEFEENA